jgi:hypothetical protein
MKPLFLLTVALLILSLMTPARAAEFAAATTAKWFGMGTTLKALGTNGTEQAVQQVMGMDGRVRGWMFRTDRVPPAIKGIRNRSEIGVLVGLGIDGRIKAVEVLEHHEDPPWFRKLQPPFFRQFEKLPADGSGKPVDTVTGATVSSKALIKDVLSACETVLALPNVQAAVRPAAPRAP